MLSGRVIHNTILHQIPSKNIANPTLPPDSRGKNIHFISQFCRLRSTNWDFLEETKTCGNAQVPLVRGIFGFAVVKTPIRGWRQITNKGRIIVSGLAGIYLVDEAAFSATQAVCLVPLHSRDL